MVLNKNNFLSNFLFVYNPTILSFLKTDSLEDMLIFFLY